MRMSQPGPPGPADAARWRRRLVPAAAAAGFLTLLVLPRGAAPGLALSYTRFLADVGAGTVRAVTIGPAGQVTGSLTSGQPFTTTIPVALGGNGLAGDLAAHHVQVTATAAATSSSLLSVLIGLLPLLLIGGLLYLGFRGIRRQAGGLGGLGGLTKAKARVIDGERPVTRFTDVAGYPAVKTEISEVVDYLSDPGRYRRAGARGPRGVLMAGPPGTGKTLLACAVAGEARVPFFSVSGSGFVEMFVGVGAARVRDLFEQARARGPAIVFIDEIDALGARRDHGGFACSDEREQTLNQLLAEMDGFEESAGVVVLAATNRPDALDPALRRPGRFDREVVVPLPDRAERSAILAAHARGKNLGPDAGLDEVAAATPGFSGADLANLINEAAVTAVRDGRTSLTAADFDAARDRVLLGTRRSSPLAPGELATVAVHEAGHALVATLSPHADPVSRVTVLGAGQALGLTETLPADDRRLYGESYLADTLAVRLGGRAAERLIRGEASTGAADDLASATALATQMVRDFGLSDKIGPVSYGGPPDGYAGLAAPRSYSEHTQQLLDEEVAALLTTAETRARDLLTSHREVLNQLTAALLEQETITGDQVRALARAAGRGAARGQRRVWRPGLLRGHPWPRPDHRQPGTGQHGASCRARQQLRLLITQSRGRASTAAPPAEVHRAKAPPRVPQPAAAPQRHGLRETDMTVTRPASAGPRRPRLRAAPRGPSGTAAAPDRAAAPGTAPARERRRSMPVAHIAVAAVAVAALAAGGVAERAAVAASFAVLGNLHWLWIPGAIMLEAASMAALAIMLRRLLAAGGTSVAVRPMLATAFAANALSVSVPLAGPELATAFTFRRFTRQGADVPLAGWSLLAGGVVSAAAGILILGGGGLASGNIPAIAVAIPGSILAVATLVMTGAAMRQPRLRGALERPAAWALRHGSQLLRRPVAEPRQTIRAWADRLGSLQLPPSGWMTVTGLALANWLADAAVLAVSIRAAGAAVPWHDLLLVYGSGIAAQSLNITPGGLGVAEGTLGVALAASGLRASQALAAVLLYRLASFWLVASAGWLVLLWLRRAHPRAAAPEKPAERLETRTPS